MFRFFICICLCVLGSNLYAQANRNIGYNIDYMIGTYGVGTQGSSQTFGQAAQINSQGNFLLRQSEANINNQIAYEHYLNNTEKRAETFFRKRQVNRFYLTLEQWQEQEKLRIKKQNGALTREDIFNIYGR